MANRAEDLIGQYLTDLFAPAPEQAGVNAAPPVAPVSTQAPTDISPSLLVAAPVKAAAPLVERPCPPPPVSSSPSLPSMAETTLAEPARQQLQQLLNTAWQPPVQAPPQPPVAVEAPTPSKLVAPVEASIAAADAFVTAAVAPSAPAVTAQVPPLGKPAWASKHFDSLLVDVAGLKLAIPLVVLGHIFQVQERFAHLPGQGPLFLGALTTPRGPLRVINTALLVMPERYDPAWVEQVQLVVSLARASGQGQPWQLALAVNRVAQPVTINSDDVVWRGERSKRPWLLGTVKSQMCALLDVDVIGQMMVDPSRP